MLEASLDVDTEPLTEDCQDTYVSPDSPALSGGTSNSRKSTPSLPEKPGYPDSVYVMAANVFQSIRVEKAPEKALIKYGDQPLHTVEYEDESMQRLSYELAFSALKCE